MERKLLVNGIRTPDGTELFSRHRHDYVEYTDKNGQYYSVDGGWDYCRRVFDKPDYEDISIYSDDSFELIRENLTRGGRGIDGSQPLTYVKLKDMSNDWVEAVIEYEEDLRPNNIFLPYFKKELEYRKNNNIHIK